MSSFLSSTGRRAGALLGCVVLAAGAALVSGASARAEEVPTTRSLTFTFTDALTGQRVAGACVELSRTEDSTSVGLLTRCAAPKQSRLVIDDAPLEADLYAVTSPRAPYVRFPAMRSVDVAVIDPDGMTEVALQPGAAFTGRLSLGGLTSRVPVTMTLLTGGDESIVAYDTVGADGRWRLVVPATRAKSQYRVLFTLGDHDEADVRTFTARMRDRIDVGEASLARG